MIFGNKGVGVLYGDRVAPSWSPDREVQWQCICSFTVRLQECWRSAKRPRHFWSYPSCMCLCGCIRMYVCVPWCVSVVLACVSGYASICQSVCSVVYLFSPLNLLNQHSDTYNVSMAVHHVMVYCIWSMVEWHSGMSDDFFGHITGCVS